MECEHTYDEYMLEQKNFQLMILSNFGHSHKCLPCFTLSAHPLPAGWGIHDGKASILLEISKFLFLTWLPCFSHSPPTFFYPYPHEGDQWDAVPCVAHVPVFPASQSSLAGSAPQPLVLQAPLSHMPLPGQVQASSKVTHPNPDPATLPSMFSTHHRFQNTESVNMSWANTFSTFSMHNHYTDNDGNCQFRAALNKEGGSFLLYNIFSGSKSCMSSFRMMLVLKVSSQLFLQLKLDSYLHE